VAITGTPIYVNGTPAISGNVLGQTSLPFYNYQLTFSSPTQLNLIVQRSALTFAQAAGSSVNTQGVAHALDSISPSALTGELGAYAINMLQAQTIAQAASMLQAIQGETLTGGYSALQGHIQAFGTQLDQRLNMATRSAQTEQTATSLLASLENDLPAHHFAKATPWGAWAQVMGSWGQRSEHEASNSYRSGASGLSIGFDRAIDSWRLGMALNTQHSVLDWQQNQAQTKADTLALALYGAYNNENWYVRGQINAGRALTHNRRNIPISSSTNLTANADSTLRFFGTRLSTGYRLHQGDLHMTPSLGLAYLHSHTNAYTESGAGNLNLQVGSARLNNLEAQANFEIKHIDMINGRRIAPRASVGFGYELWDKQINLDTSFAAFANLPAFSATSPDMGRWRSLLGLGIDIDVAKNARIFIDYLGIFKRYEYTHTGIASFKLVF